MSGAVALFLHVCAHIASDNPDSIVEKVATQMIALRSPRGIWPGKAMTVTAHSYVEGHLLKI